MCPQNFQEDYLKKLPNIAVPNINLTLPEIIAIFLLKGEGRMYKGTDIEKALDSAFGKIGMFTPDGLYEKLKKVKTLLASSSKFAKDYSGKEEIIDLLTEAMLQQKGCRMKSHRFHDDGSITLEMKTSGWWDVKKWILSYGCNVKCWNRGS